MIEENNPGVVERVKAIVIDGIVITVLMFITAYVFSFFENLPDYIRIGSFIFIWLLYDPIFTSMLGGTIGHMTMGIRVKRESDEQKNILLPWAILRYVAKTLLGVFSLITVSGDEKAQAIHDHLVGSVVIYTKSK